MKRFIVTLLLLLFIILTFSFSVIYYSLNLTTSTNTSSNIFRKKIISYPFLRKIFKLHQIGDARYDFATDENYKKLNVNVYYQYGQVLNTETIEKAIFEIKQIVKKPEGIHIRKIPITTPIPDYISDKELNALIKKYPVKGATLQIFILKNYEDSNYTGIVKDASNIFIFKDSITAVSSQQSSTKNAETSTILHEFAHLLGADHVSDETCILTGKVENIKDGFPSVISTTYCPDDLTEIKKSLSF